MSEQDSVDRLIERILAIDWHVNFDRRWSHWDLAREHVRRLALWAVALHIEYPYPFLTDIAEVINPSIRVSPNRLELLKNHFIERWTGGIGFWAQHIFVNALHWAAIENSEEVTRFRLPAPYEPLIVLYERGGDIRSEHGWFFISSGGMKFGEISKHASPTPVVELDQKTLDAIDAAGKRDEELKRSK
jgi:hypothetical protein